MLITLLLKICAFIGLCQIENRVEFKPDSTVLHKFTTKTAYRNSKLKSLYSSEKSLGHCTLVQSNTIYRHGTRFPSNKDNEKVYLTHKKIMKSHAKSILPPSFQKWSPVFKTKEKELASVGYEEMLNLGYRKSKFLHKKIPHLNPIKHIKIMSSSASRSKNSAITFYKSFLNNTKSSKEILKKIIEDDKALRFFDNCPAYIKKVINSKTSKAEYKRFLNGFEMKKIAREVQQKWKLTDVQLTTDDIRVLYVMCGYEIATNLSSLMNKHMNQDSPGGDGLIVNPEYHTFNPIESSPLCSLFDSHHYEIIEYLYDIKHYWVKSYAYDINWMQSCAIISPIIKHLMEAARAFQGAYNNYLISGQKRSLNTHAANQQYNRGTFWFGHAETLFPVITLLGLFNQTEPMTASAFNTRINLLNDPQKRFNTFRASNIAPFSGNVALDLYHCTDMIDHNHKGFRVKVLVNEKSVYWPFAAEHYDGPVSTDSVELTNSKKQKLSWGFNQVLKNYPDHMSLEMFLKLTNMCLPDKYDHDAICVQGMNSNQYSQFTKRSDEL